MNWIKGVLAKVAAFFKSGQAKKALDTAADYAVKALPVIDIVASLVVGITPTMIDDVALAALKGKFPRLFDGTILTGDELKLYMLGAATELLKKQYPQLTTSVARAAVQIAYTAKTA